MYLKPGDRVTVEELLYGLLLCSGNDAALALADHCGGLERFVAEMNRKAAELGMTGTSFANPNGLDQKGHYSTARDMASGGLRRKNETLVRLCSTRGVTVGGRTMTNHNRSPPQHRQVHRSQDRLHPCGGRTLVSASGEPGELWLPSRYRTATTGRITPPCMNLASGRKEDPVEERLQKWIARCGISPPGGRGTAAAGACDPQRPGGRTGESGDPERDILLVDGRPVAAAPEPVYLMLNKPRGYVTTLSDERGRKTAAELVADCGRRVFPVGRLDKDSEGLLLFTNDGALAQQLLHPRHQVDKVYQVTVSGALEGAEERLSRMRMLGGAHSTGTGAPAVPKGRRRCWR